jgi:hypothetical protein
MTAMQLRVVVVEVEIVVHSGFLSVEWCSSHSRQWL